MITKKELNNSVIQYRKLLDKALGHLTDAQSFEVTTLFPDWESEKSYVINDRVKYEETLYRCLNAHDSQETWTPSTSPSLWVRIDDPAIEWPIWIQPVGSTDSYPLGAKVSHNDARWISDVENNIWEPGLYGWTQVTE